MGLQRIQCPAHGRHLLPHGDIDANHVAMLLRNDGVDGECRLAGHGIAHDQFALATAQGEQRIDHQQPGLHRFGHQIAFDDCGRVAFDRQREVCHNRPLGIQLAAKGIDDPLQQPPPQQPRPHRHPHHIAGAAHLVARLKIVRRVQQHAADPIRLQHLRKAELPAIKAQQFVQPHVRQTRDHRHPSANSSTWPRCSACGPSGVDRTRAAARVNHVASCGIGQRAIGLRGVSGLCDVIGLCCVIVRGRVIGKGGGDPGKVGSPRVAQREVRAVQLIPRDQSGVRAERQKCARTKAPWRQLS